MTGTDGAVTVAAVARGVLAELVASGDDAARAELADFDTVARAYARHPAAARRAARAADPPVANGAAVAGEALATIALAVTSVLARNILLGGSPRPPSRWDPRRWRRRPTPDDAVPPVAEADVAALAEAARDEAAGHPGVDDVLAESMAWAIARDWPRRP